MTHTPAVARSTMAEGAAVTVSPRRINLALQGGGAHGAFTWGVLDRLLAEERLEIVGISGTSAGALNGAVLAGGLVAGGRAEARKRLGSFWGRVSALSLLGPAQPSLIDRFTGNPNIELSPFYAGFDTLIRLMSPYQFNPMGLNPLRSILLDLIDFQSLREQQQPRLFVGATNVAQGRLRIFQGSALSVEALLASACLPFLWQAVEIAGNYYWDGGYLANPSLDPLLRHTDVADIVVVQVTPVVRRSIPITPTAIVDRINEIGFNSAFLHEARGIEVINRLLASGRINGPAAGLRPIHLHVIGDEERMTHFTVASKFNADLGFMRHLHAIGRDAAERWLEANFDCLGVESSYSVPPVVADLA